MSASDRVAPPDTDGDGITAAFLPILGAAAKAYARHAGILLSITAVRLVPLYAFLWFFPLPDKTVGTFVEIAIVVPAVAAIVRYADAVTAGVRLGLRDGLLGAEMVPTLRLLLANVLVAGVALSLATNGPVVAGALVLGWYWATLLVDPVVVLENAGPIRAITRSIALARATWRSVPALTVAILPVAASVAIAAIVGDPLWRTVADRAVSLIILPFVVVFLTLFHGRLAAARPTE